MAKKRKLRGKIRISQRVSLEQKNDATRVAPIKERDYSRKPVKASGDDSNFIKKAPIQMPRDNGLNMRIKIRRKTK